MENEIGLLNDLGLSPSQAKVYLALVKIGSQTARHTYKVAQVARQDIYRVLIELQQLGLVEKIVTSPAKFKALPIQDGVSILLQHRSKETSDLQERVSELVEKHPEKAESLAHIDESQFILVPERALAPKMEKAIAEAQESIDLVLSWSKFSKWMFGREEIVKKLMKQGLRIRYIIEKPKYIKIVPDIVADVVAEAVVEGEGSRESLRLHGKYSLNGPLAHLIVIDDKEVLMDTSPTTTYGRTPVLWSNSRCLLMLAQNYFEAMWKSSIELPQSPIAVM